MTRKRAWTVPVSVLAAAAFVLACEEVPNTPESPPVAQAPPGACSPWPDCKDGDDGGGDGGSFTVVFPDDLVYGGSGIATTGTGTIDLTGENTADGITAAGTYSLVYDVDTSAGAICDASEHPLVALFDEVELNSPEFSIRFDKEAENGSYEINDRIRVDSNRLQNPNGDDGFLYSVWFRGKGNPGYDPATDVDYTETTDADGTTWTSVRVQDEDIFVKKLRCRNKKCKAVEVVDRDVCELAANYSLKASR